MLVNRYCEGFGYVLRAQLTRQIFWCSIFTKFFWIDDVYVTGIIADLLGLPKEKFWDGHSWHNLLPSHASPLITDFIFLVARSNQVFGNVWHRLWRASLLNADMVNLDAEQTRTANEDFKSPKQRQL